MNSKICDYSSPVDLAPIIFSMFNTRLTHCSPSHFLSKWMTMLITALFVPCMLAHCIPSIRCGERAYPHFRWKNQASESLSNLSKIAQPVSDGPWFKYRSSGPTVPLPHCFWLSFVNQTKQRIGQNFQTWHWGFSGLLAVSETDSRIQIFHELLNSNCEPSSDSGPGCQRAQNAEEVHSTSS